VLKCAVHHERNAREEKHYVYVARTSNNRVTSLGNLIYYYLLSCCHIAKLCAHAARAFPIATEASRNPRKKENDPQVENH